MFRRQPSSRPAASPRPLKPAALRPGARPGGGVRRTKPVKRASAGLTPVRAGAGLGLLVALAGLYGVASSDAFAARGTDVRGTTWTPDDAVLAALAVPPGQNVFTLDTSELEARVEQLPSVAGATVSVALPDRVLVDVAERVALVGWRVGDRTFLVDNRGTLFGETASERPADAPELPVVTDRRAGSSGLGVGSTLDSVSLDAALRLASLTPADVGSTGQRLSLRVDDERGFVLHEEPSGWTAVFGFYTPTLRTTDLIPGQVRLLRSLVLEHGGPNILRVILADERSGTWVARSTPAPSSSPQP